MDPKCKQMITKRQITQNTGKHLETGGKHAAAEVRRCLHLPPLPLPDYRLNPVLRKACRVDIPKFCKSILNKASEDSELEGQVISCLKLKYADQVRHIHLSRAAAGTEGETSVV